MIGSKIENLIDNAHLEITKPDGERDQNYSVWRSLESLVSAVLREEREACAAAIKARTSDVQTFPMLLHSVGRIDVKADRRDVTNVYKIMRDALVEIASEGCGGEDPIRDDCACTAHKAQRALNRVDK